MFHARFLAAVFMACAVTSPLAGCRPAGSVPTVPAAGRLTYQGKPLPNIEIVFTPTQGRRGSATTDDGGGFRVSTFAKGDGAVPGRHRVTLWPAVTNPLIKAEENPALRGRTPEPTLPFPKRYSSPDSPLIVDLGDRGSRNLELQLEDGP